MRFIGKVTDKINFRHTGGFPSHISIAPTQSDLLESLLLAGMSLDLDVAPLLHRLATRCQDFLTLLDLSLIYPGIRDDNKPAYNCGRF